MAGEATSASSAPPAVATYDVFLNFRGVDTRDGFVSHLYARFSENRVEAFMDEVGLDQGQEISPTLLRSIEESRIAIVVFLEEYATSRWCLDELVKMVEGKEKRGQVVFPVFYGVDPWEVRHQTGRYNEDLARHRERGVNPHRLAAWCRALTATASIS